MATSIERTDRRVAESIKREERFGAANYAPLDVVIERGDGVYLWDTSGARYLDCISAYSAVNQGHCHPRIREALIEQAHKVTLTSRAVRNDRLPLLLEELTKYCGQDVALVMNTGVEAVETAIKLARRWGYRVKGIAPDRARIIVCSDNFHGRTTTIISASSEPRYRADFGPFTPGFTVVPYGDAAALSAAVDDDVCAFLFEPIQGEGGVNVPPSGYLAAASALAAERGFLLLGDEIQTGFGRTGDRFALDFDNIVPDVLIVGKALGGGYYPVSAALASRGLMALFQPGDHGSTFGGNPLACEVARAALAVTVDEHLAENAKARGHELLMELAAIRDERIVAVRGRGLLIGVELDRSAAPLSKALAARGILAKDTHERVLRIAPPLILRREHVGEIVAALVDALGALD